MKKIKGWKSFLILMFVVSHSAAQKNNVLIIPLRSMIDSNNLVFSMITTENNKSDFNYDPSRLFKGIPSSITDGVVKVVEFQPAQAAYELYLRNKGVTPVSYLVQLLDLYHADTLQLSRTPIKHMVYLFTGFDQSGNRVVIVDANNNYDFSDDKVMLYNADLLKSGEKAVIANVPVTSLEVQFAANRKVYTKTCNLKFSPVCNGFRYFDPEAERLKVVCIAKDIRQGSLTKGNSNYLFSTYSDDKGRVTFTSPETKIDIKEKAADGKVISSQKYVVGDTVLFNQERYLLSGISIFGDSLKFSYLGKNASLYGIDSGKIAYNIESADLNGNKFDLQKYRGKYVLIDFWGTWCNPCIASIPELVAIASEYKSNLQVVSIALDQPDNMNKMREMIKSRQMDWIHIFQNDSDQTQRPIIKNYKVEHYPTQILIDPDGKIVLRTFGISGGEKVRAKLKEQLGK